MVHLLLKGLLFRSGREIVLTGYRCIYQRKKKSISIKNLQLPGRLFIFIFEKALFKERFKDPSIKGGHVLTLHLDEAEKRTF
jgi:hypothetical protein